MVATAASQNGLSLKLTLPKYFRGIPGNIYISAVKHKKAFSAFLIGLTLLTSMQFVSYLGFDANIHPGTSKTQIVSDSQEVPPEFRESNELAVQDEIRPEAGDIFQKHPSFDSGIIPCRQSIPFEGEYLLKSPSKKLFIAFGALIL